MSIATRVIHGAKVCIIPLPENTDRPLALRHRPLAAISGLLIIAKVLAASIVLLTPASADLSTITTARIIQLTNAERQRAGLSPLTVNAKLASAAAQKGNHMLQEDYFAHVSPSGVTPWFWMSKVGYSYQVAGENLAIDFIEAEDVVAAWLASPSHRDNLLNPQYTETGIGVVTGEFEGGTSTVVVHMFGLPTNAVPAAAVPATIPSPSPAVKASTTPPTPSSSPTPVVPSIAPTDTTPPRIPRIAIKNNVAGTAALLTIEGEAFSRVYFLLNNQPHGSVVLTADGTATHTLSLDGLPDGTLVLRTYSTDQAANQSEQSEPLALVKDTQGPLLAQSNISFILSPATDNPAALIGIDQTQYSQATITQNEQAHSVTTPVSPVTPLQVTLTDEAGNQSVLADIQLSPTFTVDSDQSHLVRPSRFTQLSRRITASVFAAILGLLILAILIRVRIQRPTLIAHASFVLLLAGTLFFF